MKYITASSCSELGLIQLVCTLASRMAFSMYSLIRERNRANSSSPGLQKGQVPTSV